MSRPEITPDKVTVDRPNGVMNITWADGHASAYPITYIREQCPCALCKGYHGEAQPFKLIPFGDQKIPQIGKAEFVGRNVAIRFTWDDGHDGGIYDWVYLREICPCEECKSKSANL